MREIRLITIINDPLLSFEKRILRLTFYAKHSFPNSTHAVILLFLLICLKQDIIGISRLIKVEHIHTGHFELNFRDIKDCFVGLYATLKYKRMMAQYILKERSNSKNN